MSCDINN